jgi:hypothetical protein
VSELEFLLSDSEQPQRCEEEEENHGPFQSSSDQNNTSHFNLLIKLQTKTFAYRLAPVGIDDVPEESDLFRGLKFRKRVPQAEPLAGYKRILQMSS